MLGKVFVGSRVSDLDTNAKPARVSRVSLIVDGEHTYTAGDDSGRTIEKNCPWGTQAMADSILERLRNVDYQPFSGTDSLLDPAAELGDGITAGDVYSVLAREDITFDGLYSVDIAAPGGDEVEDEYPYKSRSQRQRARETAQIYSSITKTAEEIKLLVENTANGISSEFSVKLDGITARVTAAEEGLEGAETHISTIEQYAKSIRLSVTNGETSSFFQLTAGDAILSSGNIKFTGFVTFEGLSGGSTSINGACINTGKVSADRIDVDNLHVKKIYGSNGSICVGEGNSSTLYVGGNGAWNYDNLRLFAHDLVTLSDCNSISSGIKIDLNARTMTSSSLWDLGSASSPWGKTHTGTQTIYSGATPGMTISYYKIYSTQTSYLGDKDHPWNYAYITNLYLNGTELDPSKYLTAHQSLADYAKTKSIYRLYAGGSNAGYYLTYNSSHQLIPNNTGSVAGSCIGSSNYPFYWGYFTGLTVQNGTLNLGTSIAKIGFFGASAQSRKSVSTCSTSSSVSASTVASSLNSLINALKGYGLIN